MTPTERQMIEDAARAIGLNGVWLESYDAYDQPDGADYCVKGEVWNPLTNPADTYMLMERLKMDVSFGEQWVALPGARMISWSDDEPDAAHAITRCAAKVWRMKK